MIKKQITFEDFDGNPVVQEHYFHLSKDELIQMEVSEETEGGMAVKLQAIVEAKSGAGIIKAFKDMIRAAYGQRDPSDPTDFVKTPEATAKFMRSPAFDALLTELLSSPVAAAEFANGMVPKDLGDSELVKQARAEASLQLPISSVHDDGGDGNSGLARPRDENNNHVPWAFRKPTSEELRTMDRDQLMDVTNRMNKGWTPPSSFHME